MKYTNWRHFTKERKKTELRVSFFRFTLFSFSSAYKSTFLFSQNRKIAKFHAKKPPINIISIISRRARARDTGNEKKHCRNKISNYFVVTNLTYTHTETNQHKQRQERFTTEYGKCAWKQIDKWTHSHTHCNIFINRCVMHQIYTKTAHTLKTHANKQLNLYQQKEPGKQKKRKEKKYLKYINYWRTTKKNQVILLKLKKSKSKRRKQLKIIKCV